MNIPQLLSLTAAGYFVGVLVTGDLRLVIPAWACLLTSCWLRPPLYRSTKRRR